MVLDREKLIAVAKGAGIAAAGAVLAYAADVVIPAVQDSGSGVVLTIAAMASVLVNALRKALASE